MSGYILCQKKKAVNPYFIENIGTNIYTIEELCYYLYHNIYLIDQTLINENLFQWLQEELEMSELAGKLRALQGKFAAAEDFLYPVFKSINYLSYEELKSLNVKLQKFNKEAQTVREKRKGDSLVENGMYIRAIHTYQRVLERDDLAEMREGFSGTVWYNLGCTYSYLFQKEKALECFWKSYELLHTGVTLKSYLLTYAALCSPEEYESRLAELGVDSRTRRELEEEQKSFENLPETPLQENQAEGLLESLTREYHRNTES